MITLIQDFINALSLGSLYALLALGVALIFGIMSLINFAHGELIMIGAYGLFLFSGPPALVLFAVTIAVVALAAVTMERVAFRPVRGADPATLLVTSFAISFMLQNLTLVIAGGRAKSVDILPSLQGVIELGEIRIDKLDLAIIGTTALLVLGLGVLLKRTSIGIQMRASAENFDAARLMGVRANRVVAVAFAVSGVLASVAAIFLVARGGAAFPTIGLAPVLIAFVSVVIGGLGSLRGAVAGAFVLGFLTVALQAWLPASLTPYRDAFVYTAVIVILLARPQGIFPSRALRGRIG